MSVELLPVITTECVWMYTYLYNLESLLLDSFWIHSLYTCFMCILLRLRTQSMAERLTLLMPSAFTWSSMTFCCITSTMRVYWCGENIGVLPPACGTLAILQKENMQLQKYTCSTRPTNIDRLSPKPLLQCNTILAKWCTETSVYIYSHTVNVYVMTKKGLPVLCFESQDSGGHSESAHAGLFSLSCFPHCHSMDKNMVYHSSSDFIRNYYSFAYSISLPSSSSWTTSYTLFPSATQIVSVHCTTFNNQCSLNWLILISSHHWPQVWSILSSCV